MTILNTIELTETAPWVTYAFAISFVIFFLFLLIGAQLTMSFNSKIEDAGKVFIVIGVISLIVSIVLCAPMDTFTVPSGKYQYEVMIDDETSFIEVAEQYTIVEQRGEIFVLEEKE